MENRQRSFKTPLTRAPEELGDNWRDSLSKTIFGENFPELIQFNRSWAQEANPILS